MDNYAQLLVYLLSWDTRLAGLQLGGPTDGARGEYVAKCPDHRAAIEASLQVGGHAGQRGTHGLIIRRSPGYQRARKRLICAQPSGATQLMLY